jgi:F-type H+-transporting ATPase subunit b
MSFALTHPALASSSGSFLVQPSSGLTVWTIVVFLISMAILAKWVFPRIREGLDRRASVIEESIDSAARAKEEADRMLEEYRDRLREARRQAEEIVDLTVMATEKVTRKVLTPDDQRRLVEEALSELDFSALTAGAEA